MCFLTMTLLLWPVVLRELLKFNLLMDINDATLEIAGLHFVSCHSQLQRILWFALTAKTR